MIGTASEKQLGIPQSLNKWPVNNHVKIRKNHGHSLVRKNLFISETGIAPDGLAGFFLYSAGKFGETLDLVHRIPSREGHIAELVVLDDSENLLDRHFPTPGKVPGLGIVTTGTMVCTSRTIDRCAKPRPVGHCFFKNVQDPEGPGHSKIIVLHFLIICAPRGL